MRTIVLLAMLAFSGTTCFAGDRCCRVGLFARICERVSHRHDCCAPVEPVCCTPAPVCCTPAPRHCEPHAECSMVCCLKCGHNHCKDVKCCNPCCPEKPDCGCKPAAVVATSDCANGQCHMAPSIGRGRLYEAALASAQYRAANRIKGHSYLDMGRTSGVGYASHNPTPNTCLGTGGDNYAVVKGPDGWYASKLAD